ncbi:MAG: hypothetical protein HPAVJP_4900 [Candidatus Hepatoplasma vulgare]|nr:MAG: hypothetical protein HPAVJP_4900 [Candidatus Hepatoplasma sp.]
MSAKVKFLLLVQEFSQLPENSEQEIQKKMQYIQGSSVSFAILWTFFWVIIFLPTIFIWIFVILINWMNYSKRKNWRQSEYERLWYKLNTLQMNEAKIKKEDPNNNLSKKEPISTEGLSKVEAQIVKNYQKQAEKEEETKIKNTEKNQIKKEAKKEGNKKEDENNVVKEKEFTQKLSRIEEQIISNYKKQVEKNNIVKEGNNKEEKNNIDK